MSLNAVQIIISGGISDCRNNIGTEMKDFDTAQWLKKNIYLFITVLLD